MILYRITSKSYAQDLSGTGAMLFGGRWNNKGIRMLYTSGSLSLATLEIIANLSSDKINKGLYCVEINFPDSLPITELDKLPQKWDKYPFTATTMAAGTKFIKQHQLCLKVPSALIPTESNYLLNPLHKDFDQISILDSRAFMLNQRLVKI